MVATLERRGTVTLAIGDDGVRITVGLPAENDRHVDHWAHVQNELGVPHLSANRPEQRSGRE